MNVKTVSAWLGHASTKLTLDTYGHWMGTDADRAAIARVERAYGDRGPHDSGDQTGTISAPGNGEQARRDTRNVV